MVYFEEEQQQGWGGGGGGHRSIDQLPRRTLTRGNKTSIDDAQEAHFIVYGVDYSTTIKIYLDTSSEHYELTPPMC